MFADLNIYDAASVVGQFIAYLAPTFFLGTTTFTLDPVALVVSDMNKVPYPLLPNPTMFSINGFNYVLDTNRVPHAVIGNNNVSPLATDVTVQSGQPIPSSTFTLNGLVYMLTEDASHNLLAITGTKSYPIAQPALTFKLEFDPGVHLGHGASEGRRLRRLGRAHRHRHGHRREPESLCRHA